MKNIVWLGSIRPKNTFDEEKIKYAFMQLEGHAYNRYMWWKFATKVSHYSWARFKDGFFKMFQGLTEKYFFAKFTRIKKNGDVDEYSHEGEALATSVPELSEDRLLHTYVYGLKPYLKEELRMHDITTMEKARCKRQKSSKIS
jgi:hypothetical protein